MKVNLLSARKAISAVLAGVAFCTLLGQGTAFPMGKVQQRTSASNLYSEADLAFLSGRNLEALNAFQGFLRDNPDSPEGMAVRYKIARIYFNMGDFQNSISASMEWLNLYPENPLRIEVMSLLGSSYNSLGNKPESLRWRLTALKADTGQDFQVLKEGLKAGTIDLIKSSSGEELEEMAGYAADSDYIPYIFHRLALISLEEERPEDAGNYALQLVRSSQDETWVSIGRELLDRVTEKKGGVNDEGTITIGCLLPLTGPFALYGQEVLNGIMLGMDLFNVRQEGCPVELVIRDTMGDAEKTVAGLEELVREENVTVILGPLASNESTAAAKKAQELGIPIITFSQKDGITNEGDMVFRNFLTPSKEIEAIVNRAIAGMGIKKIAVFYPDKTYGRYMRDLFREEVRLMGGAITADVSYEPDQTDFSEAIKKLVGPEFFNKYSSGEKDAGYYDMTAMQSGIPGYETIGDQTGVEEEGPVLDFEAVFIPDNYQKIAMIAPQFPYYGIFNVPFFGTSLWMSDDLISTTGSFIQGAIFPVGFSPYAYNAGIDEFLADYRGSFQEEPDVLAANGYDTIKFIRDILDNNSVNSRNDLQKKLFNVDFRGVTGEITFGEDGEVRKEPLLMTVEKNVFKIVE
ncbi:MAG: penicillin-binding protein activator [Deltaproteobacteria bacterium]|nr:penicillin-binding protein activator [Deltaproteobacteria bacterium]